MAANIKLVKMSSKEGSPHIVILDDNAVIPVMPDVILTMRKSYQVEHLQDTRLTNEQLVHLAAGFEEGVKGDNPELLEDITKADPPQKVTSMSPATAPSATGRDALSIAMGAKLAAAAEACNDIKTLVTMKAELKRLPASIPFHLETVFTIEDRRAMPIPGSVRPEGDRSNSKLYDREDDKPGTPSWYGILSTDFPGYAENIGIPIERISAVYPAKNAKGKNEYSENGDIINEVYLKKYKKQAADLTAAIRDAISFLNFRDEVHEKTDIRLHFWTVLDDNGVAQVIQTLAPIRVVNHDKNRNDSDALQHREKFMSVGAVMKVDLAKVIGAKDQFVAFQADRAESEEEEGLTAVVSAKDLERVVSWVAVNRYNQNLRTMFVKRLSAPDSGPLLALVMENIAFWEEMLTPKMRARYKSDLDAKDATKVPESEMKDVA